MQTKIMLNSRSTDRTRITTEPSNQYHRTLVDYRDLERALSFDDVLAARDAFDRLQQDAPYLAEMLSRDPFPDDNRRLRALKELGKCLQAGDLDGAHSAARQFH